MRKKEKIKNRVSALLLSGVIVSGLIAPAFSFNARAEALPEILESSATVADCVMSYYAMSGSAIANTDWINTLYNSLGSSFGTVGQFCADGLLTYADEVWQPTQELVNNIENASAYTELGLDTVFNVSAEEVAAGGGVAVATGGTTLAGATGCVASTGILPVLGGVTASYWGGIALGTLIAHAVGLYDDNIVNGVPINFSDMMGSVPSGNGVCSYIFYRSSDNLKQNVLHYGDCKLWIIVNVTGYYEHVIYNKNLSSVRIIEYATGWNAGTRTYRDVNLNNGVASLGFGISKNDSEFYNWAPVAFDFTNNQSGYNDYYAGLKNGQVQPYKPKSPDLIGENGNLEAEDENGNITVPDMKPQIDPGTQAGKPLSLQDWLDFANQVQNNNNNVTPTPDGNQGLFGDIMDLVRTVIPTPGPSPDPGPDPGPNPDPETYPVPGPVPDPNDVPDPDYQPETRPQPDFTEKQTENQTDITEGDPWTTPDLLDKFPFCIPKDIYRVFTKLDSKARSAPHIQWRFHPNNMIDYTFDIDFSQWDSIAVLLRTLELLAFIVGLAIGTRKLIIGG